MMSKRFCVAVTLAVGAMFAYADEVTITPSPSTDSAVATVSGKFKQMYPNTTFSDIRPSDIPGMYEVDMGTNIAYTDTTGRYFIFGHLFDMQKQVDITSARESEVKESRRVQFPIQYLGNAIKTVHGDGSRVLAVFSDPNCPYCKKLEAELSHVDNVTIYTFLYPVLGEDSKTLAIATWCSKDQSNTWEDWMIGKVRPHLTSCTTPLNDNLVLGSNLGVTGTPTLITDDGKLLPGSASSEKIGEWLGAKK